MREGLVGVSRGGTEAREERRSEGTRDNGLEGPKLCSDALVK
jgi:hypothetical protein